MKKLKYIVAALVLAFSFTACNLEMPPEDNPLPMVDIVQRSELLDMVNIDYVLDDATKQMLADKDVSVSMANFELTADYMAQFVLTFDTSTGSYKYKVNTVIDYTANADGSFDDVRLYWGSVKYADGGLLITSLYDYAFLPLDKKVENFVPHHLTFIKDNGGYIVHSAADFGRYAFIYRTAEEEGIVVLDENDKLVSHFTQPYTYEEETDVPFSYEGKYNGELINENLFMMKLESSAMPSFLLYNVSDNTLSENAHQCVDTLTVGGTQYTVYEIFAMESDKTGFGGLAIRKENGQYTGVVMYDTKGFVYEKQAYGTLSLNDDGQLVFHSQPTGVRFTIDFELGTCERDYLITEDMLGEKIDTSKDKNYCLYEYGLHQRNNYYVSYLALKNEKTGEIGFIDQYKGVQHRKFSLDAGFFSNGDIYLLTDYDFEIYTTDAFKNGPVFSLGERFPLGVTKDDGEKYNALHAVRRDPVDGSFIVVFDHLPDSRWYTAEYSDKYDGVFNDKYEVALRDKDGNIIKTYMTDMYVGANKEPLNMYLSGNLLTLQNLDRYTGQIVQKGTLNIKTGEFILLKEWKQF